MRALPLSCEALLSQRACADTFAAYMPCLLLPRPLSPSVTHGPYRVIMFRIGNLVTLRDGIAEKKGLRAGERAKIIAHKQNHYTVERKSDKQKLGWFHRDDLLEAVVEANATALPAHLQQVTDHCVRTETVESDMRACVRRTSIASRTSRLRL